MIFRHMAMLRFKPDATAGAKQAFFENFPKMATSIPQINPKTNCKSECPKGRGIGPGEIQDWVHAMARTGVA